MPFLIQPDNVNSCGAFAIAYYQWLRWEGRTPQMGPLNDDGTLVATIYGQIQFGNLPGPLAAFNDNSNPVLMMEYLQNTAAPGAQLGQALHNQPVFYRDGNNAPVAGIYNAINTPNAFGPVIGNLIQNQQLFQNALPALANGQYAIVIFTVHDGVGQHMDPDPDGMHYILFRRANGQTSYYNSWNGEATPVNVNTNAIGDIAWQGLATLRSTNCGILLP